MRRSPIYCFNDGIINCNLQRRSHYFVNAIVVLTFVLITTPIKMKSSTEKKSFKTISYLKKFMLNNLDALEELHYIIWPRRRQSNPSKLLAVECLSQTDITHPAVNAIAPNLNFTSKPKKSK